MLAKPVTVIKTVAGKCPRQYIFLDAMRCFTWIFMVLPVSLNSLVGQNLKIFQNSGYRKVNGMKIMALI